MALLERVTTLIRANVNDLLDQAEDPEKLVKQIMLDMRNQLLQVKTEVAIAMADQHMLQQRHAEHEGRAAEWMRRAERALEKGHDDLARAALERALTYERLAQRFAQHAADQTAVLESLTAALRQLEQKLAEVQASSELLVAQHRRARAVRASMARGRGSTHAHSAALERLQDRTSYAEAIGQAQVTVATGSLADRFAALEREEEIERLLAEMKSRRQAG